MKYEFSAKLWIYEGNGAWVFVTLPKPISAEIKELFGNDRTGFGSIRIEARIGTTSWKTSIFPDKKRASYVLPLKADVRKAAGLKVGDSAKITLEIDPER